MPRKKRYTKFHICHHVMLRGNAGQAIFIDDQDRTRLCMALQKASEEHKFLVHAFCLMNNHMHLILEPTIISLSRGVHAFAGVYAQYFNRRHKKRGHLFQDRFRSILIEDDDYLKRLVRYVHLNPVRANLVKSPKNYRWSSYNAYLAEEDIAWLTQMRILRKFGLIDSEARQAFVNYTAKISDAEQDAVCVQNSNKIGAFASDEFIKEVIGNQDKSDINRIKFDDLIAAAHVCFKMNVLELSSENREKGMVDLRSILALAVQKTPGLLLHELANYLNRDSSSLCRLIKRAKKCPDLLKRTEALLQVVSEINQSKLCNNLELSQIIS